jgi:hypothetical protein
MGSQHRRQTRRLHGTRRWAALTLWLAVVAAVAAGADGPRRRPVPRSRPPASEWDAAAAGIFFDDAFGQLVGPRPAFGPAAAETATVAAPAAAGDRSSGFAWSSLISGDTLIDEIKDMKDAVAAAVASPSSFKGGGYGDARRALSTIAVAFGLIAAHDEDVRWQRDADAARRLFARAGFRCKAGNDQTFAEARLCLEDLEGLLDGNPPRRKPEAEEAFLWSGVVARPAIMARLEEAERRLAAGTSSPAEFGKQRDLLRHEAELAAAMGEIIRQPDFEYHDDDTYRGHAAALRDAAVRIRDACRDKHYDAARAAVGDMSTSCTDCHGGYR